MLNIVRVRRGSPKHGYIFQLLVVDDTCLLQLVQHWLHRRDCSSNESVTIVLMLDSLVVLWILHPIWVGMWAGGTISNCFNLTPHDELVAPFFRWLGQALGYMGTDHLNIFELEEILWNLSQGMNPKRHLFGKKGEAQWEKLDTLKIKQREDTSTRISF